MLGERLISMSRLQENVIVGVTVTVIPSSSKNKPPSIHFCMCRFWQADR